MKFFSVKDFVHISGLFLLVLVWYVLGSVIAAFTFYYLAGEFGIYMYPLVTPMEIVWAILMLLPFGVLYRRLR